MTTNIKNEVSLTGTEAYYLNKLLNKLSDGLVINLKSVKFTSINNESTIELRTGGGLTKEINLTTGASEFLNKDK